MKIDSYADSISLQMNEAIRKAFNAGFQYAQSLNLNDEDFVDLGLPSGTLWAKNYLGVTDVTPEGDYFTFCEAMKQSIPTEEQFQELEDNCSIINHADSVKVIGPNGSELIFSKNKRQSFKDDSKLSAYQFPAQGYTAVCSCWLRTSKPTDAKVILLQKSAVLSCTMITKDAYTTDNKYQIRLVKCAHRI